MHPFQMWYRTERNTDRNIRSETLWFPQLISQASDLSHSGGRFDGGGWIGCTLATGATDAPRKPHGCTMEAFPKARKASVPTDTACISHGRPQLGALQVYHVWCHQLSVCIKTAILAYINICIDEIIVVTLHIIDICFLIRCCHLKPYGCISPR